MEGHGKRGGGASKPRHHDEWSGSSSRSPPKAITPDSRFPFPDSQKKDPLPPYAIRGECGLPVFRLKAGRTLSDDEIKDLLTEGHTQLLKGFKSKQGKSFDAVVAFDGEYNTTFVFPEAKKGKKFSGRKK